MVLGVGGRASRWMDADAAAAAAADDDDADAKCYAAPSTSVASRNSASLAPLSSSQRPWFFALTLVFNRHISHFVLLFYSFILLYPRRPELG